MAALESLTLHDGIGTYRPRGRHSLVDAVNLVATALAQCRAQGVRTLLVDATGLEGLPIPSLLDRFLMVEDWAAEADGKVVMAMVAEPQYIHPRKFGVTVARHLGMVCDVFDSEPEAVAWMATMMDPASRSG